MKSLAALIVTFAALNVHAEVKAPGTVLATSCAQQVHSNAGNPEVCFASVIDREGSFLTIGEDVWAIRSGSNPIAAIEHVGTITKRRLQPRLNLEMRVGQLQKIGGDAVEITIKSQTLRASKFQSVIHTESL